MKKSYVVAGIMVLAAVLLVLPMQSQAEMYVEAYLGGVQGANSSMDVTNITTNTAGVAGLTGVFRHNVPGNFDPAVMGGLKLGTWFVKDGFLGHNYPDWMKYLGFYLDFSYHRLNFSRQEGTTAVRFTPVAAGSAIANNDFFSEGTAATLAFMFAARYGFLADSEVPFGRLQPYIGVGPAILFSTQRPQLTVRAFSTTGGAFVSALNQSYGTGSSSSADICLAVEAGIRYMALKNVSIDVSFKYRYAAPSYTYEFTDPFDGARKSMTLSPSYNLFSGQIGAAYHF